MPNFAQHTILLTGATGGIGQALTQVLTAAGAHVIALGRSQDSLDRLLPKPTSTTTAIQVDLSNATDLQALLTELRSFEISGVLHAAGLQYAQHLTDPSPQHWGDTQDEITVNFTAPIQITSALLPTLIRHRSPFVSAITSSLALAPKQEAPTYCATKAGMRHFLRALRYQTDASCPHVLVNEVIPALVDTPMTAGRGAGKDSPQQVALRIVTGIAQRKTETWVGRARLLRPLNRLSPALVAKILK